MYKNINIGEKSLETSDYGSFSFSSFIPFFSLFPIGWWDEARVATGVSWKPDILLFPLNFPRGKWWIELGLLGTISIRLEPIRWSFSLFFILFFHLRCPSWHGEFFLTSIFLHGEENIRHINLLWSLRNIIRFCVKKFFSLLAWLFFFVWWK